MSKLPKIIDYFKKSIFVYAGLTKTGAVFVAVFGSYIPKSTPDDDAENQASLQKGSTFKEKNQAWHQLFLANCKARNVEPYMALKTRMVRNLNKLINLAEDEYKKAVDAGGPESPVEYLVGLYPESNDRVAFDQVDSSQPLTAEIRRFMNKAKESSDGQSDPEVMSYASLLMIRDEMYNEVRELSFTLKVILLMLFVTLAGALTIIGTLLGVIG